MPDLTGVSHIERDADRSASWYEQVLGMQRMDLPEEFRNDSVPAREVNMMHPTAGLVLSLIQHEAGEDGDFYEFGAFLSLSDSEGRIVHEEAYDDMLSIRRQLGYQ